MTEVEIVAAKIAKAATAEDVFGDVAENEMTSLFRHMARVLHPDVAGASPVSDAAMSRLLQLRDEASSKFARGTYGQKKVENDVVIRARYTYRNVVAIAAGDLSDVYAADYDGEDGRTHQAVVKLVRDQRDEDLAAAEWAAVAKILATKANGLNHYRHYVPVPIETAKIVVGGRARRANVFRRHVGRAGRYTLADVMRAYPGGVDTKTMAWMWRRMLEVLAFVHQHTGIIHGAVLPEHVLVDPVDHGARLVDWSYSVPLGSRMKAIPADRADWYPPEVATKGLTTGPGVDVYTSARVAIALVGGDAKSQPEKIQALLRACLIPSPSMRHSSAAEVYKRFDEVLRYLFGPPSFHPFTMRP